MEKISSLIGLAFCLFSFAYVEATSITFLVAVPEETSPTDTIYIMGNLPELGNWAPAEVPLNRNPDGKWQIDLEFPPETNLYYYYTKGSRLYLEKGPVGEAVGFRIYTVPDNDAIVNDTVFKWGQFGPYLSWVNHPQTTMVISWRTDKPGNAMIEYGFDTTYGFSEVDSTVGTLHSIELTDLNPSTIYHYRVSSSSGEVSVDNTFSTAKYQYEPFTFVSYGDTRTNDGDRAAVVSRIIAIDPDIVFNTGDLVEDGRIDSKWITWFSTNQDILDHIPYFVAIGNHEENAQLYYDYWHFPGNEQWYSLDYGNAHFVCLSTETNMYGSQREWLESDLINASQSADWIFVFFHRPPYSSGEHGSDLNVRTAWCSLFETYGVDIVFNGHDHNYERGFVNGVYYIVTGGGGAPLRTVGSSNWTIYSESTLHCCKLSIDSLLLNFEAIKPDGTVFDGFTIDKTIGIDEDLSSRGDPESFKVWQNYPNPFNANTKIRYQLPKAGHISVEVYNLTGQRVRRLVDSDKDAGCYYTFWDGKDKDGVKVNSGIYFCRISANTGGNGSFIQTKKMLLIQ
ncbi:MAG: metallophosphoesterase [candidate division WOR-3 bacterium]|nr:metallophosphoesterase [candidate division WOR-3 bacterium]